jgi:hypothetical protein
MIAEWGYSLLDSLKRVEYDADCELFLKILTGADSYLNILCLCYRITKIILCTGEIGEDVYYDQQKALEKLLQRFIKLDSESNSARIMGVLSKSDIKFCTTSFHYKFILSISQLFSGLSYFTLLPDSVVTSLSYISRLFN